MYVVTGEKTYLLTDYRPTRKYVLAQLTDGNGKRWWQLAYRWGFWTYYLRSLRASDLGGYHGWPLAFDSPDAARQHLADEQAWLDHRARSKSVTVEFANE
jgi:hypothetical protein